MQSEGDGGPSAQSDARAIFLGLLRAFDEEPSEDCPESDDGDLTERGRDGEDQDGTVSQGCGEIARPS